MAAEPDRKKPFEVFPPRHEAEMQKLIGQLTESCEDVRQGILAQLRPAADPQILRQVGERLIHILQNGEEAHWPPAMASLADLGEHALPALLAALGHHPAGAVRVRLLEALAAVALRLDQPLGAEVQLLLWGGLCTGAEPEALLVCGRAVAPLRRLDPGKGFFADLERDASMPIPSQVVDCPDLDTVFAQEANLTELTAERQAELLEYEQRLVDPDETCRRDALALLRLPANQDLVPHLTHRLVLRVGHGEEPSWRQAMTSLAEFGEPARDSLNLGLLASLSASAKARLLEALGAVGLKLEPAERETLQWYFGLELSADQPEEVRQASARALAALRQLGQKEAQAHIRANRRRGRSKPRKGQQPVPET